jgi:hypothetical protein
MQHTAFEIYAGDADAIREACAADRLDELRSGQVTPHVVSFPEPFTASDIGLVEEAVATIAGRCEPLEFDRTEEQGCLFVDRITTPWVASVANLGTEQAGLLLAEWSRAYQRQEWEQPAWNETSQLDLLRRFIAICKLATKVGLDLVMVWQL